MEEGWKEVSKEDLALTISMALLLYGPKEVRIKDDELRQRMARAVAEHMARCGERVFKEDKRLDFGYVLTGPEKG